MDRLTHRYMDGQAWASIFKVAPFGEHEVVGEIISRLAAYEDIGMTPAEIMLALHSQQEVESLRKERDAAIADLYHMGGCPNCKFNVGRSERTGLPICKKRREYPDGKCFEWRGVRIDGQGKNDR